MQPHTHHQLPTTVAMQPLNLQELMDVAARLTEILVEESGHLAAMKIDALKPLHEEKLRLTRYLEDSQKRLAADPFAIRRAPESEREELLQLTDDLSFSVEENFRRAATARAVNSRVMQAITDTMSEFHRPATYGRSGTPTSGDLSLSFNLNEKA